MIFDLLGERFNWGFANVFCFFLVFVSVGTARGKRTPSPLLPGRILGMLWDIRLGARRCCMGRGFGLRLLKQRKRVLSMRTGMEVQSVRNLRRSEWISRSCPYCLDVVATT